MKAAKTVTVKKEQLDNLIKRKSAAEAKAAELQRDNDFMLTAIRNITNFFSNEKFAQAKAVKAFKDGKMFELFDLDKGEAERFNKRHNIF